MNAARPATPGCSGELDRLAGCSAARRTPPGARPTSRAPSSGATSPSGHVRHAARHVHDADERVAAGPRVERGVRLGLRVGRVGARPCRRRRRGARQGRTRRAAGRRRTEPGAGAGAWALSRLRARGGRSIVRTPAADVDWALAETVFPGSPGSAARARAQLAAVTARTSRARARDPDAPPPLPRCATVPRAPARRPRSGCRGGTWR